MTTRPRISVVLPLVLALLFRAAIPAGFMPMAGADGGFTIALCPGVTSAPLPAGHDPHAHHHGKPQQSHTLCPFAATAGPAPLPGRPSPPPAISPAAAVEALTADASSPPSILRSQQSRAPPRRAFA